MHRDGHDHDHEPHAHEPHAHEPHAHAHPHAHPHAPSAGETEHTHPHAPSHTHAQAGGRDGDPHEHPGARQEPIAEGAGRGQILFLDAFSGLAGDMIIAALLDLGVPLLVVERAVGKLPLAGFHLHRGHTHRSGIVAATFDVHVEAPQPERTYKWIDDVLANSLLADNVKTLARKIFRRLGEAEAAVHRMPLDDVHFHEVGAVDAIVDIVGAAACFEHLGASVVASPLPMGHGFVNARHGILPLPAPATITCLAGVPTYGVDLAAELVTPTGAAIVATVAERFERWPSFLPSRTGWGAGHRELPDRPNVLRAVLGSRDATVASKELAESSHVVVESNLDDMTGELAGHAIDILLAAGAVDAWATPITMKKGRPALMLSALAPAAAAENVAAAMLRETPTLGVRFRPVSRTERPREMIMVETSFGPIPVKRSDGGFGPPIAKPEFDACAKAAELHGVPVRVVLAEALAKALG
jgi:pyridinium-3,5-bisthiocarboxylic acid mononucleotide nickel chelatase